MECDALASSPYGWSGLNLVDADQFKQYNDSVGHLGGDACLRSIGHVFAEIVQTANGSIAARIGGEEFAVILPNSSLMLMFGRSRKRFDNPWQLLPCRIRQVRTACKP